MTIVYPRAGGERFDWGYYLDRHLPLAVGTSMRHSAITACWCDRPLEPEHSPIAAICVVAFARADAQRDFCEFFARAHPDSAGIIADEPNYTSITPSFTATSAADAIDASPFRVRILLPRARVEPQAFGETLSRAVDDLDPGRRVECASGAGSIPLDSPPPYDRIWTVPFATADPAISFARALHRNASVERARAVIVASEFVPFDLARAAVIRDRQPQSP